MVEGSSPARPSPTVLKMWAESQPSPGGMASEHAAPLYIDYESLRRRMQLAGYGITVTPSVSELSQLSGPADNYSIYSTPAPSVLSSPPGSPRAFGAHSPPESSEDFSISPVIPCHAVNVSASSTASRASGGSRQRQQSLGGKRPSPKPRVLDFDTLAVPSGEAAHPGNPAAPIWPFNQTSYRPSAESPPIPRRGSADASAAVSVSSMDSTDIFVSLQKIAGGPLWDHALRSHRPVPSQQSSMRESFGDLSLSQMASQTMRASLNQDHDSSTNPDDATSINEEPLWGEALKSRPPASSVHSSEYTESVLLARTGRSFDSGDVSDLRRTCGVVPEEEEANHLLDVGVPLWGTTLAGHPPLSSIQSTECDAYSAFGDSQNTSGFPVLLSAAQEPAPDAQGPEDGPFKNYFLAVQQQQQQQQLQGPQQAAPSVAASDLVSSLQSWTAVSPPSGGAASPRALPEDDSPPPKGSEPDCAAQSVDVREAGDRPRGPEYWKGRAEFWASRTEAADASPPLHASLSALPAASSAQGSPVVSASGGYRLPTSPKEDLRQQVILLSASRASTRDLWEDSGSPVKEPNNEAALADSYTVCSETMSTTVLQSEDVSLTISSFEDDSKAAMETGSSLRLEAPLVSLSPEKSDSPVHITPRGQSDPRGQMGILSPDDVEVLSKAVKEIQGELTAKPQSEAERAALVAKYSQLQAEFMALQEKAINDPVLRSSVTTPRQVFEMPPSAAAATHSPGIVDVVKQKATVAKGKATKHPTPVKQKAAAAPIREAERAPMPEPRQPKGCFNYLISDCLFNRK